MPDWLLKEISTLSKMVLGFNVHLTLALLLSSDLDRVQTAIKIRLLVAEVVAKIQTGDIDVRCTS